MSEYLVSQDCMDEVFALRKGGMTIKEIAAKNSYGVCETVVRYILKCSTRTVREYYQQQKALLEARHKRETNTVRALKEQVKVARENANSWRNKYNEEFDNSQDVQDKYDYIFEKYNDLLDRGLWARIFRKGE